MHPDLPRPLTGKWLLAYRIPMTDVFEALAAPARRAILDELTVRNGQTLFELCTRLTMRHGLGLTRQAISQHLEVLEAAGLVTTQRQGRYKFHYLDTTPLRVIVERWLTLPKKTDKGGKR
jgi:DNA-binding transcriptional ArsR family regulator